MKKKKTPSPFKRPAARIEIDYGRSIQKLLVRHLPSLEDATADEILEALNNLVANETLLERFARVMSARMVTAVSRTNARSWRQAAMQSTKGRAIYEALKQEMRGPTGDRVRAIVAENARLISSIPSAIREHINNEIATMTQEGLRPEAVERHLRERITELTKSRARLIARTEVGKSELALTQARSEDLGIEYFVWKTSSDVRVRQSHRVFEDVLCTWKDLPSPERMAHEPNAPAPYGPGGVWNCRCIALPVVSLDTISWPCKVYTHNSITRMGRAQFVDFSGMRQAA